MGESDRPQHPQNSKKSEKYCTIANKNVEIIMIKQVFLLTNMILEIYFTLFTYLFLETIERSLMFLL